MVDRRSRQYEVVVSSEMVCRDDERSSSALVAVFQLALGLIFMTQYPVNDKRTKMTMTPHRQSQHHQMGSGFEFYLVLLSLDPFVTHSKQIQDAQVTTTIAYAFERTRPHLSSVSCNLI